VIGMGARARLTAPAWIGLALIVVGFLVFVGAYFLLPLYVTTWLNCFDSCHPPMSATTWEFLLRLLSDFGFAPIGNALVLALLSLPLLGAVVGVGGSIAYRVRARRAFAVWSNRAWVAGTAALFLMLPLLLLASLPEVGYLGMLLGYGLFWAGSRLLHTAPPQWQVAS
jgi:hypothetical protein